MSVHQRALFFLLAICLTNGEGGAVRGSRPSYEWSSELNHYFKIHREPAGWNSANTTCHSEGAELVALLGTQLTAAVNKLQHMDHALPAIHTGGRITAEGVATCADLLTNSTSEITNGGQSQRSTVQECCTVLYANGTSATGDCDQHLPFICYTPMNTHNPPLSFCGDASLGYEYAPSTGSCYKFHTRAEHWPEARAICQQEGADLTVINNEDELNFLKNLFAKHSTLEIDCHGETEGASCLLWWAAIGFYYQEQKHDYQTINGEAVQLFGKSKFVKKSHKSHGYMHRDGFMSGYDGALTYTSFICEKPL